MNETLIIIGYIVGVIGIVISIIIYQQKTRKGLFIWKLISDAVWALHYLFLAAYSGFAICAIAVLRELIFMNRTKYKWANHIFWPIIFSIILLSSTILTWQGPISIIPPIASVISLISFWIGKPKVTRIILIPVATMMIIYDVLILSYPGIANESFSLISAIIGIIHIDIMQNKRNKENIELEQHDDVIE